MAASHPPTEPPTYWELEAELPSDAEEVWSLFCYEQGATGAEWREESGPRLRIAYFFNDLRNPSPADWLERFRRGFPHSAAPARVSFAERTRSDWATAWREHFSPVPVGGGWLVCPPWQRGEGNGGWRGRRRIVIDPGQGFGTGRHASTALALELLEDRLRSGPAPRWLVDVGTGSGILAIAARLSGAGRAVALDIDPAVFDDVRRNARLNGIESGIALARGGPECLRGSAPLVLANLVMPLLLEVSESLAGLTAPGGSLIVSGALEEERPALTAGYEALGLRLEAVREREGWIAAHFIQPS